MISPILLIVLFALCVVYYICLRFSYSGRLLAKVPGVNSYPIIGNLFAFAKPPDQVFSLLREVGKSNKAIVKLQAFNITYICVYDPADVETILSSIRFNEKRDPYVFLSSWLGEGLITGNGEKWQHRRKMLTRAFHFNILKQFFRTFCEHTQKLLEQIEKEVGKEKTDVMLLMNKTTLNILCETSMGISNNEDIETVSKAYFKSSNLLTHCVAHRTARVWMYIEWLYKMSPTAWKEAKALKEAHEFTDSIIDERKIHREMLEAEGCMPDIDDDYDFEDVYGKRARLAMLDLLLEGEKEGKVDRRGIREEVDTFMFAGHDTTSAISTFMIMRIANEPKVQDLIYEELRSVFGDSQRLPIMEDLNELKYLECCIKESLRIYPSVPTITRHLLEDVELGGYKIPSGTNCLIHIYDIHHREDLYPEPEKFIPERFLVENSMNRHKFAYIPFSAGPRNCIGQRFAMLELKTVMSSLLRRYCLEPVTKPEDVVFVSDLILRARDPVYVRFVKRDNYKNNKF